MRLVISFDSIGTSSSMPRRSMRFCMRSPPKMRSRSSCRERIEARTAGIALAAGAAAKLVIDAARFVPLGADDVQAAERDHFIVLAVGLRLELRRDDRASHSVRSGECRRRRSAARRDPCPACCRRFLRHELGIAAEQNVGTAAGHVGGDGDRALAPGLRDDGRFALVILGVQHFVLDAHLLENAGEPLGLLDRDGADQHRLALLVAAP